MQTIDDLKNRLLFGEHIFLDNEEHCINVQSDDFRGAECYYEKTLRGLTGYVIWFNGALIHSSKTFASFEKRLNKLIDKWHLTININK